MVVRASDLGSGELLQRATHRRLERDGGLCVIVLGEGT